MENCQKYLIIIFNIDFEHNEMITELRKRRFIIPINNYDVGKSTIQTVGVKLFNEEAPLLKLEMSINTYRKHIKKVSQILSTNHMQIYNL